MELSFFEIYNEAVLDLLQTGSTQHRRRKVRVHPAMGVYVEGLTYEKVSSWAQCLRFLTRGLQQRHTAATKMNEVSSRSHAIFQLRLVQTDMTDIGPVQHRSNAYLADLAGSERIKLSAVEGDRLKESAQINLSLTTLRRVIDALIQAGPGSGGGGNSSTASGNPTGLSSSGGGGGGSSTGKMVPYRESMLTWVLSESLGGNARACMVATLCPHPTYVEETYQTLQYAHRAKSIVNSVVKNEDQMAKMLRQLQDALAATARGGAQTAMTATASVVEGVDPSLHFELEDRVKKQDSLIRKLREEQMLMLTKYADLKDVYESLKDEHAREVDLHEVAQQQTKTLHGKYDALRQQLQALKTRNDALEATDEMRALDAQRAAMECERLEHWKTQADLAARRMEQDLAQANEERQRLRGEVDHLTTSIERTMAKHQGELHQAKLAHDRDLSAFRHLQHWYDKILHSLWEGCFSTRRVNVQLHLSSWACDWASACHARSAALAKRVDALQAQLQDLEFVNTAQDRSLTQVASAYVDVREFLHCIESRSGGSGGAGGGPSTGSRSQSSAEANWTVAGILQALHRFCNGARQSAAVSVRAAAAAAAASVGEKGGVRSPAVVAGHDAPSPGRARSHQRHPSGGGGGPLVDASPSPRHMGGSSSRSQQQQHTPWKHPPLEAISPIAKPPRRAPPNR